MLTNGFEQMLIGHAPAGLETGLGKVVAAGQLFVPQGTPVGKEVGEAGPSTVNEDVAKAGTAQRTG